MTPTVRTTQCVAQPPASPTAATPTSRCPNPGCRRPFEDCVCKGGYHLATDSDPDMDEALRRVRAPRQAVAA